MCLLSARSAAALSASLLLTMPQHIQRSCASPPRSSARFLLASLSCSRSPAALSTGFRSSVVGETLRYGNHRAGFERYRVILHIRLQGASRLYCPLRGGLRSRAAQWHPGRTAHVWVGPGGHPLLDSQYPSQVIPKTHLYRRVRWVTALIEPNPRLLAKCSHLKSFAPGSRHLISRVRG